jgi:hypothetical protein
MEIENKEGWRTIKHESSTTDESKVQGEEITYLNYA